MEKVLKCKIMCLDEGSVGVSTLVSLFLTGKLPVNPKSNLSQTTISKEILMYRRYKIELEIWEVNYNLLSTGGVIKDSKCDVYMIVYSTIDEKNRKSIKEMADCIDKNDPNSVKILVGTKTDLRDGIFSKRFGLNSISREEGEKISKSINAINFFETCASDLKSIKNVFHGCMDVVVEKKEKEKSRKFRESRIDLGMILSEDYFTDIKKKNVKPSTISFSRKDMEKYKNSYKDSKKVKDVVLTGKIVSLFGIFKETNIVPPGTKKTPEQKVADVLNEFYVNELKYLRTLKSLTEYLNVINESFKKEGKKCLELIQYMKAIETITMINKELVCNILTFTNHVLCGDYEDVKPNLEDIELQKRIVEIISDFFKKNLFQFYILYVQQQGEFEKVLSSNEKKISNIFFYERIKLGERHKKNETDKKLIKRLLYEFKMRAIQPVQKVNRYKLFFKRLAKIEYLDNEKIEELMNVCTKTDGLINEKIKRRTHNEEFQNCIKRLEEKYGLQPSDIQILIQKEMKNSQIELKNSEYMAHYCRIKDINLGIKFDFAFFQKYVIIGYIKKNQIYVISVDRGMINFFIEKNYIIIKIMKEGQGEIIDGKKKEEIDIGKLGEFVIRKDFKLGRKFERFEELCLEKKKFDVDKKIHYSFFNNEIEKKSIPFIFEENKKDPSIIREREIEQKRKEKRKENTIDHLNEEIREYERNISYLRISQENLMNINRKFEKEIQERQEKLIEMNKTFMEEMKKGQELMKEMKQSFKKGMEQYEKSVKNLGKQNNFLRQEIELEMNQRIFSFFN